MSQEKLETMLMQNLGGQTKIIIVFPKWPIELYFFVSLSTDPALLRKRTCSFSYIAYSVMNFDHFNHCQDRNVHSPN